MSYFNLSIKFVLLFIIFTTIVYYASRSHTNRVVNNDPYWIPVTDTTKENKEMISRLRRELNEVTLEEEYINSELS